MSSITSEEFEKETFDWKKYLILRHAEEVPKDFFHHICESEKSGIEFGSVVEVENVDQSGYWYASVFSSVDTLIGLHYLGDENDKHDFWLEVGSSRIHPLNWGSKNNKKLVPPHPYRFSHVNLKTIKEKVDNCEHVISNAVLQMKGASIYNIIKPGMFVEVLDKEFPYRVWITKVLQNVGGRLLLKMKGDLNCPETMPFWLFYLNERIFPLGWADQKGLPWRVMNSNSNSNDSKDIDIKMFNDSSLLLNILKPKTPEQHSYKVGEMLEVLNPYSLMVFYVGTIIKIYDNRYFRVEVNNECEVDKRLTFVATKENPYLFNAGWARKHKFLLKPPSDWIKPHKFCWSEYILIKESKLACVDNMCRKKTDNVHIGMKLEAVDPIEPYKIRVATIKGLTDHWMLLSFDRTSWCQELLHVRSIYSDDVFPAGWCNKHKYSLSVPKLPYTDCNDYDNCYYASDIDIEFKESNEDDLVMYSEYFKGEIPYHFSEKAHQKTFEDNLEETLQNLLQDDNVQCSSVSNPVNNKIQEIIEPNVEVKIEPPELDEEFHDALFFEEVDTIKEDEENAKMEYKNNGIIIKEKSISKNTKQSFHTDNYTMCIYFNKNCYTGSNIKIKKLSMLPNSIGPGSVSKILHQAITLFVELDYSPCSSLKNLKKIQHLLFNEPGGVEVCVTTMDSRTHCHYSEYLNLPESKIMAKIYCSALCKLFGMCENFMTNEKIVCPYRCNEKLNINSKLEGKTVLIHRGIKRKAHSDILTNTKRYTKHETLRERIDKLARKRLDWSNEAVIKKYQYYLACICSYENHMKRLRQSFTEIEFAIIKEIQTRKWNLRKLNEIGVLDSTKPEICNDNKFFFIKNWKRSFQNYYKQHPKFKKFKIDIGHIELISVASNPLHWSPLSVYKYLSNDPNCKQIGRKLFSQQVDGVSFMLLKEENLIYQLGCDLNLTMRIMCHAAQIDDMNIDDIPICNILIIFQKLEKLVWI